MARLPAELPFDDWLAYLFGAPIGPSGFRESGAGVRQPGRGCAQVFVVAAETAQAQCAPRIVGRAQGFEPLHGLPHLLLAGQDQLAALDLFDQAVELAGIRARTEPGQRDAGIGHG